MVIFNKDVPRKFPRPKGVVDSLDCSEVRRLQEAEAEQRHLYSIFGRPFVKTVRPVLSDYCLSVLSVLLVFYGQTVRWIKMKLGMQVGLDHGHIVLDGNSAFSPKGHSPQFSAHICCGQIRL